MVGAPFSAHSSNSMVANQSKYAPPHQAYATPNATLSTVLPYGGGGNGPTPPPSGYPNISSSNHYPPTTHIPSGYPPAAQPYTHPMQPAPNSCLPGPGQSCYPPPPPPHTNNINYAYPPIPSAPPSNCLSQLTPPAIYPPPSMSYSSGYPTSVYPAAPPPQPYSHGTTYPPAPPGGAGVYPPPQSAGGYVYPPSPY